MSSKYQLGSAVIQIVPSMKGITPALKKELGAAEKSASKSGFGSKLFKGVKLGALAAGGSIAGVFSASMVKGFQRLSAIEQAEAKLRGLGHSAEAVESIMANALSAVKGTAFGMDEAASLAGTLVASGIKPGKELEKILRLTADSATIAGKDLGEMGLIWSSVAAKGKLQGDDAMQLLAAGVPIWQMVAKEMGVTTAEAQKLGSEGKVSFDIFARAMEKGVGGAALESGNTTVGAFKNMSAALSRFGAEVLKGVFPLIGPAFKSLTGWIDQATAAVGPLAQSLTDRLTNGIRGVVDAFNILKSGGLTPDVVKAMGLDPATGIGFVLNEAIGGVKAFASAWKSFDGEVTSAGFPEFMEQAAFAVRSFWEHQLKPFGAWVAQHWKGILAALGGAAGAGGLAVAFGKISAAVAPALRMVQLFGRVLAVRGLAGAVSAVVAQFKLWIPMLAKFAPFLRVALGPVGLLVGALGYLVATNAEVRGSFMELGRAIWDALSGVVQALAPVVAQIVTTLAPVVAQVAQVLVGALGQALQALAPVIAAVVGWVAEFIQWLTPALPVIVGVGGAVFAAVKAFGVFAAVLAPVIGAVSKVVGVVKMLIPVVGGAVAAVGWVPIAIAAAVAALVLFFTKTEMGRKIIATVWAGIKAAIGAVVDWFTGTAIPAVTGVLSAAGQAFQWLYRNVIVPVWTGIKTVIAMYVAVIMTIIDGWVWLFKNTVAPVFTWLWKSVIVPVWNGIKSAISGVVSWFQGTALPAIRRVIDGIKAAFGYLRNALASIWRFIRNSIIQPVVSWFSTYVVGAFRTALGWLRMSFEGWKIILSAVWRFVKNSIINPVVSWFQNTVVPAFRRALDGIKNAFQSMRDRLSSVWSAVRNRIVQPVVSWFQNTVRPAINRVTDGIKNAFNRMKDGVGKAWEAVKNKAKAPIKFVVDTVVNRGIVSNFNKVAGKFGVSKLPSVSAGFARGGILPGRSSWRDGDDQLVPMRRGEGVIVSEALRDPVSRDFLHRINAHALRGGTLAEMMGVPGYSIGGIVDWGKDAYNWGKKKGKQTYQKGKELVGHTADKLEQGVDFVSDAISDPLGALKKIVNGLLKRIPAAGVMSDLGKGAALKLVDAAGSALSGAFAGSVPDGKGLAGAVTPAVGKVKAGGSLGMAQRIARSFGLTMTSFRRGGARTSSGSVSLHSLGRAMDFSNSTGPTPQMMGFFNAMHPYRPTELLYSPAGPRQWRRGGRMSDTSGAVRRLHWNHVHVGFAKGGILSKALLGAMQPVIPTLYDSGGWLEPGVSQVVNKTRAPEAILTSRQWDVAAKAVAAQTAGRGGDTFNISGPDADAVVRQIRFERRKQEVLAGV